MRTARFLLIASLSMVSASSAWAQASDMEQRLREQLRQTVTQLRDLQNNQATLQAQKESAEKERDALKAKAGKGGVSDREVALLKADLSQANAATRAAQTELERTREAVAQATEAARQFRTERDAARTAAVNTTGLLNEANGTLATCAAKNGRLVALGNEILDRYEKVGLVGVLATREPFVGLKRVELENAAQALGDKVYENRFDLQRDRASASPPPAAPQP